MPFQSEKQRRYLWANEPEIARDWTDTYGSRIQKNNGGLTSIRQGYFSGGDIIQMGLKQIAMSQAKKKAQEYGYLPEPTQKKSAGSFLAKMLANIFLGPVGGLMFDAGSAMYNKRNSPASNFNMSAVNRTPTNRAPTAQQKFRNQYNVSTNPQGRMVGGPFAGQNMFGKSAFGSKTAAEQAQRNLDRFGKTAPQDKIDEWTKMTGGDVQAPKAPTKTVHSGKPTGGHHQGGGGGIGSTASKQGGAPGTKGASSDWRAEGGRIGYLHGGLATLWQR